MGISEIAATPDPTRCPIRAPRWSGIAILIVLLAGASTAVRTQATSATVQTIGAVHTASFATPLGIIRVHVAVDASAGDAIAGTVVADPAGGTPQARAANLAQLNGFAVEWQGRSVPVSEGRYEWSIPATLRTGSGILTLRDREGRLVAQATVPVDPVPAPAPPVTSAADAFELPTEGQRGKTAVIRGSSNGTLAGVSVSVGGTNADIVAVSPRQIVFRVPATNAGPVPLRFASGSSVLAGTLRVLDVSITGPRPQLGGQRTKVTFTVAGLAGITEPVTLTLTNRSTTVVRVEDIEDPITIEPRQAARQGTFSVSRNATGLRAGIYEIDAIVSAQPLKRFDVGRSMNRTLADWQVKTGVGITPDANAMIQRSVTEARTRLGEFLRLQQGHEPDLQTVFAALLSHYCFDLRDDVLARTRPTSAPPARAGIRRVALGQAPAGGVQITPTQVQRESFSDFLSGLLDRFNAQQALGYLFVRSMPAPAAITLDGKRDGALTNRRFVTTAGDHQVVVALSEACRQRVTVIPNQTKVVDCAAPPSPARQPAATEPVGHQGATRVALATTDDGRSRLR